MTNAQLQLNDDEDDVQIHNKPAEKRAKIDEEILLLRERIRKLSAMRNSLAPVASLPSEILDKIFGLAQTKLDKEVGKSTVDGKIMLWITRVCRQWRSIALDNPLLWAEINETNRRWAVECIKRSKKSSLIVDACSTSGWQDGFFEGLLQEMPRIQQLAIYGGSRHAAQLKNWVEPIPILETLKISGGIIPENLYSLELPALRVLELEDCRFSKGLPAGVFSALTKLTMKRMSDIGIISLLESLSSSSNLEYLEFSGLKRWDVHGWNTSDLPRVNFPKLSTLILDNLTLLTAIQFIRHISVPPKARGLVTCKMPRGEQEIFSDFMGDFRWRDSDILGLMNLGAERLPPRRELRMTYWQKDGLEWVDGGGFLDLCVAFECDLPMLLPLLKHLPIHDLEILLVHTRTDDVTSAWRDIFAPLPSLKVVVANSLAACSFVKTFISMSKNTTESPGHPHDATLSTPFPGLKELNLKDHKLFDSVPDRSFESFCEVLESRNLSGLRLRNLEIYALGAEDVDKLKLLVDEVIVVGED
ncbi:hypothetical protein BDN72DRAFT_469537, partial [Pluteus cervinus]